MYFKYLLFKCSSSCHLVSRAVFIFLSMRILFDWQLHCIKKGIKQYWVSPLSVPVRHFQRRRTESRGPTWKWRQHLIGRVPRLKRRREGAKPAGYQHLFLSTSSVQLVSSCHTNVSAPDIILPNRAKVNPSCLSHPLFCICSYWRENEPVCWVYIHFTAPYL